MAKYATTVTIVTDEPLSRRDYKDLVETVESSVTGSGGKWDPVDFGGEVTDVTATMAVADEEDDD